MAHQYRVDPVLAELLATRAVASDSTPSAWLSALLGDVSDKSHASVCLSTMGPDGIGLYHEVTGLPYDVTARLHIDFEARTVTVRQMDISADELTYCGLAMEGDAFFDGPILVPHARMALPDSLLLALTGMPASTAIETGMEALGRRAIATARVTDYGLTNARMGWKGEESHTLEIRLAPADPVIVEVNVAAPPTRRRRAG